MKKIYAVILIAFGSFLEIWYYAQNFTNEGTPWPVAWIIACVLTAALTLLSNYYKKISVWFIIIPLILFSIYITSSGQAAYLQKVEKTENTVIAKESNSQSQLDYYLSEIKRINDQIDLSNNESQTDDINDLWKFEGVINRADNKIKELEALKKEYELKVESLMPELNTSESVEVFEKYDLYHEIFNINLLKKQFITQVLLSFFIAILSPIGIIVLNSSSKKTEQHPEQPETPKQQTGLTEDKITLFVKICWIWYTKKTSKLIVDYKSFEKIMRNREIQNKTENLINTDEYKIMYDVLLKNNFIDNMGFIIYDGDINNVINLLIKKIKR